MAVFIFLLFAVTVFANETCESKADVNKLSGASKASFLKKCESDAKAVNKQGIREPTAEKNMSGAAKSSLLKLFLGQHKI